MSVTLQGAKESPRYEDGIIKWYEGDSFSLNFTIKLRKKGDDTEFKWYNEGYSVVFEFYSIDDKENPIKSFTPSVTSGSNVVSLEFTPDISKDFVANSYTFCIKLMKNSNYKTTIGANQKVVVEKCH